MPRLEAHVVSCPRVGHGNPVAAEQVAHSLRHHDLRVALFEYPLTTIAASIFHRSMTGSTTSAKKYESKSDGVRNGIPARIFGIMQALELEAWLTKQNIDPTQWHVIQEMQVAGASATDLLQRRFGNKAALYVPDVYPKNTATSLMQRMQFSGATVEPYVWNSDAFRGSEEANLRPHLTAPLLDFPVTQHDRLRLPEFARHTDVLLKTSGSGMPEGYIAQYRELSEQMPGLKFALCTPREVQHLNGGHTVGRFIFKPNKIADLYAHITAIDPLLTIAYPSEMVGWQAARRASRNRGALLLLDTSRGTHEAQNRAFALQYGLAIPDKTFSSHTSARELRDAYDRARMMEVNIQNLRLGTENVGTIFCRS